MSANSLRATKKVKELGYLVGAVDSYSGYTGTTTDLFGFLDSVAVTDKRIIGLQWTSQDYSSHIKKIEPLSTAKIWNKTSITYLVGVKKMKVKLDGKQEKFFYRIGYFNTDNKYVELQTWKERIDNCLIIKEHEEHDR